MRAVVQRVRAAKVVVADEVVGEIERGLLVYLGAGKGDTSEQAQWMAQKILALRIFPDEQAKLNLCVADVGGQVLVVSQFTLYGDVRRGRRPSFERAAPPELAEALYEEVCAALRQAGLAVQTGRFRTTMEVHGCVHGPVTILVDSERTF